MKWNEKKRIALFSTWNKSWPQLPRERQRHRVNFSQIDEVFVESVEENHEVNVISHWKLRFFMKRRVWLTTSEFWLTILSAVLLFCHLQSPTTHPIRSSPADSLLDNDIRQLTMTTWHMSETIWRLSVASHSFSAIVWCFLRWLSLRLTEPNKLHSHCATCHPAFS